ncbi:hypothetical protein EZS27_023414 [termite gut metagenome]|uniref:Uncharacterized protein n=1 Tax=termite gut metagenome TaxID=433724 RepID=A0A5J4R0J5_9ZZZZ
MKDEKFKVLLYLKKSSPDKSGKTPIMRRITVGRPHSSVANSPVLPRCGIRVRAV